MKVLIFIILLTLCMSCGQQNTQNSDKNVVQVADSVQFRFDNNIQYTLNKDEFNLSKDEFNICEVLTGEDERSLMVKINDNYLLNSTAFPYTEDGYYTLFIRATNNGNGFCYAFSFGSGYNLQYTVYQSFFFK